MGGTMTTMLTPEQVEQLEAPIDRDRVKGREGPSGRTLSYLSQSDVKAAANRIFGVAGWSYETVTLDHIGDEPVERVVNRGKDNEKHETGTRVAYKAHVRASVPGASYSDWGYGEDVSYTSVLQPHELAVKEAVSDALKRCMVALGEQFGLSLYEEAAAMRSGGGGGGRGRQRRESQTAPPPTLTEADLRQIHAERNKFGVTERDLKWLARFVGQMPNLVSMKEYPRSARRDLIDALGYFASNPADAEAQMREAGVEPPPEAPSEAPAEAPDPDEGGYP